MSLKIYFLSCFIPILMANLSQGQKIIPALMPQRNVRTANLNRDSNSQLPVKTRSVRDESLIEESETESPTEKTPSTEKNETNENDSLKAEKPEDEDKNSTVQPKSHTSDESCADSKENNYKQSSDNNCKNSNGNCFNLPQNLASLKETMNQFQKSLSECLIFKDNKPSCQKSRTNEDSDTNPNNENNEEPEQEENRESEDSKPEPQYDRPIGMPRKYSAKDDCDYGRKNNDADFDDESDEEEYTPRHHSRPHKGHHQKGDCPGNCPGFYPGYMPGYPVYPGCRHPLGFPMPLPSPYYSRPITPGLYWNPVKRSFQNLADSGAEYYIKNIPTGKLNPKISLFPKKRSTSSTLNSNPITTEDKDQTKSNTTEISVNNSTEPSNMKLSKRATSSGNLWEAASGLLQDLTQLTTSDADSDVKTSTILGSTGKVFDIMNNYTGNFEKILKIPSDNPNSDIFLSIKQNENSDGENTEQPSEAEKSDEASKSFFKDNPVGSILKSARNLAEQFENTNDEESTDPSVAINSATNFASQIAGAMSNSGPALTLVQPTIDILGRIINTAVTSGSRSSGTIEKREMYKYPHGYNNDYYSSIFPTQSHYNRAVQLSVGHTRNASPYPYSQSSVYYYK